MTYKIITQIIGIIAMSFNIMSFQCKKTRNLFIMQGVGGLLFSVNFFMLGTYTGALLNLLNIVRNGLLIGGKKFQNRYICAGVCAMFLCAGLLTYSGFMTVIVIVAQICATVAMWTQNSKILRIEQFFVTSPLWLTYNVLAGSIGGVLCETFSMCSLIVFAIRRFLEKNKEKTVA